MGSKEDNFSNIAKPLLEEEKIVLNATGSATFSQSLATWGTSPKVMPSLVEKWSYWLGAEIVMQWRSQPVEECSVSVIFEEINPQLYSGSSFLLKALEQKEDKSSLFADLQSIYKQLCQQQNQQTTDVQMHHWLVESAINLARCYNTDSDSSSSSSKGCLGQLRANMQLLQTQLHQKLQRYFYILRSGGSRTALECLETKSEELQTLNHEYERYGKELSQEQNAQWQAFLNLSAHLVQSKWFFIKQRNSSKEASYALKALWTAYKFQLEAHLCNIAHQLLQELKQAIQQQASMFHKTDMWLAELQSCLDQQHLLKPVAASFLKQYLSPRIDSVELRQELDKRFGSLFQWETSDIPVDIIIEEILVRVRPLCWEFYAECLQINEQNYEIR